MLGVGDLNDAERVFVLGRSHARSSRRPKVSNNPRRAAPERKKERAPDGLLPPDATAFSSVSLLPRALDHLVGVGGEGAATSAFVMKTRLVPGGWQSTFPNV